MGDHFTKHIIKLKERGVISNTHANTMLELAKVASATGSKAASKILQHVVVDAIAELISKSLSDR
jgi:hypothetical protein